MTTEEKFDKIIQDAISKGNAVKCDPETYRQNLGYWINEIQENISASEECS